MTHVTQKEKWGYRDVLSCSRLGGVLGADSHISHFMQRKLLQTDLRPLLRA